MKDNLVRDKSYAFAVRMVNLYKHLSQNKKEFVLSKQILRSGTSVGVNIEEAIGAQSKKDFITKLSIVYKEIRETGYWIRLLRDTEYLTREEFDSIFEDCDHLQKIIGKIKKTATCLESHS